MPTFDLISFLSSVLPREFRSRNFNTSSFQTSLARFNHKRLAPALPNAKWQSELREEKKFRILEGNYIEELRRHIFPLLPSLSTDGSEFVTWFESLNHIGPGQHHPFFTWLANESNLEEMKWFLAQEAAGEAGFDDLLAYTQVRLPPKAKVEMARNYWDEMGRGKASATHSNLLDQVVQNLQLSPSINETVYESLALSNVMIALAVNRRYLYQSIGALGVIELTAPSRVAKIASGMERLGIGKETRAYYDIHAKLDLAHSRAWIEEVITPLVIDFPTCAPFIAEGALIRLTCGKNSFDRYQRELHEQ